MHQRWIKNKHRTGYRRCWSITNNLNIPWFHQNSQTAKSYIYQLVAWYIHNNHYSSLPVEETKFVLGLALCVMHLKKTNSRPASIWDGLTYRTYNNTENVKILGNTQENPWLHYGKFITAVTDLKELLSTLTAQQYSALICQSTLHENSVKERNGLVTKSWSIEFLQEKNRLFCKSVCLHFSYETVAHKTLNNYYTHFQKDFMSYRQRQQNRLKGTKMLALWSDR